jgi:uncharacterized membrane protein YhaH (DUF805 family)
MKKLRWDLRRKSWVVSLTIAVGGFLLAFLLTSDSVNASKPNKMSIVFAALLAAACTFAAALIGLKRLQTASRRLLVVYALLAVLASLAGTLPGYSDNYYKHLWGAPLLLGLAASGVAGLFSELLVGWMTSSAKKRRRDTDEALEALRQSK